MQRRSLITLCFLLAAGALMLLNAEPRPAGIGIVASSGQAQADSLIRILALRVEFAADQVATTTGTGRFDYGSTTAYALDRPPHNRTYFQQQLQALSSYFARVSKDRIRIAADVFPTAEEEALQLGHDMVWYSGQENEVLQQQRWAELLRDAVQLAISSGGIDFSRYDYLIVFHSGVGQDFAFDFDTTPFDIQSVYIDAPSLASGLGQDPAGFKGIECPGNVFIRDGIILPETQNQESLDLGLLGTMTLLFGSQIGMPSLFDTESGRAGIGMWGLMDQGSYNFQGFIPAEPSAWEKVYMGWEEPVVVQNQSGVRIGSSRTASAPHIIKVPVTASEYFLIENRQRDPNRDRMAIARDEGGKKAEFDSTGRAVAPAGIGVLTRVDEYDFGLPNSGILIWHVDEKLIRANLAGNTINADRNHRGVDLVECDGAQDIGYVYSMFDAGYGTENGDYWDPWWSGNESYLVVNSADQVVFSASSIPGSNGYGGGQTGIRIDSFSSLDTVMTLNISSGLIQAGFPRLEAVEKKLEAASLAVLAGVPGKPGALFAATSAGELYAWRGDGEKLFGDGGAVVAYPLSTPAAAPFLADLDGNGKKELYYSAVSGEIFAYSLEPQLSAPGLLGLTAIYPLGDSSRTRIALADAAMLVGDSRGKITVVRHDAGSGLLKIVDAISIGTSSISGLAVSPDGMIVAACDDGQVVGLSMNPLAVIWQRQTGNGASQPLIADFNGDGRHEVAAIAGNGAFMTFAADGVILGSYRPPIDLTGISAPAIGDIDLDGLPEIICAAREGAITFEFNGAVSLNNPVMHNAAPAESILSSPVFAKKKNGAEAWFAVAGSDGLIHAFNQRGEVLPGFPLSAGASAASALVLSDLDGDGNLELAALGSDGSLNVWDLGLAESDWSCWPQAGGTTSSFCLEGASTPIAQSGDLMPAKKIFCYPNPVSDGSANIRFTLTKAADRVTIRLFSLAGLFVGELSRTDLGSGDHEVPWDITKVQSGVYLAKVEARSGGDSSFKVIKIAVTK